MSTQTRGYDNNIEEFIDFAVDLLAKDLEQNFPHMKTKRSAAASEDGPGYYALPLPHIPHDVRDNLSGMKLATNVDPDLVQLANSLFGSDEVLRPVVNYQVPVNPLPPSTDPFDLTPNYKPNTGKF